MKDAVGKVTGRTSKHEEEGGHTGTGTGAGMGADVPAHGGTEYTGGVAGGPAFGGAQVRARGMPAGAGAWRRMVALPQLRVSSRLLISCPPHSAGRHLH